MRVPVVVAGAGMMLLCGSKGAFAGPRAYYGVLLQGYAWGNTLSSSLQFDQDFAVAGGTLGLAGTSLRAEAGQVSSSWDDLAFAGQSFQGLNLGVNAGRVETSLLAGRVSFYDAFTGQSVNSTLVGARAALPFKNGLELTAAQILAPDASSRDRTISSVGVLWRPRLRDDENANRFTDGRFARLELARSNSGSGVQLSGGWSARRLSLRTALRGVTREFSTAGNPVLRSQRSGLSFDGRYALSRAVSVGASTQTFQDGFGGHSRYGSVDLSFFAPRRPSLTLFARSQNDNTSFGPLQLSGDSVLATPLQTQSVGLAASHSFGKTSVGLQVERVRAGGAFLLPGLSSGSNNRLGFSLSRPLSSTSNLSFFGTLLSPAGASGSIQPRGNSTYFAGNLSKRIGKSGLSVNFGVETEQDRSFGQTTRGVATNVGFYLPMGGGNALGLQYRKSIAGGSSSGLSDTLYLTIARDVRIGRKPSAAKIGFLDSSSRERRRFGSVRGRVFDDQNDNGRFDPDESGVPDVQLSVPNASPGRTGSNGSYSISALYPQKYALDLNLDTLPIEYAILSPSEQIVSVPSGGTASVDIPVRRTGNVRGIVFRDENRNGSLDEGERTIANAVVRVEGSDAVAFSDDKGRFVLSGLAPKTWKLNVDAEVLSPDEVTQFENVSAFGTQVKVTPNTTTNGIVLGVAEKERAVVFEPLAPIPVATPAPFPTPVVPAAPVEAPAPVEPTPVEPTPVEPTPVEPTPVEPTPVEPTNAPVAPTGTSASVERSFAPTVTPVSTPKLLPPFREPFNDLDPLTQMSNSKVPAFPVRGVNIRRGRLSKTVLRRNRSKPALT